MQTHTLLYMKHYNKMAALCHLEECVLFSSIHFLFILRSVKRLKKRLVLVKGSTYHNCVRNEFSLASFELAANLQRPAPFFLYIILRTENNIFLTISDANKIEKIPQTVVFKNVSAAIFRRPF